MGIKFDAELQTAIRERHILSIMIKEKKINIAPIALGELKQDFGKYVLYAFKIDDLKQPISVSTDNTRCYIPPIEIDSLIKTNLIFNVITPTKEELKNVFKDIRWSVWN